MKQGKTKIYIYFLIFIVLGIIIYSIWKPEKTPEISSYQPITEKEAITELSEKYLEEIINLIAKQDISGLYEKLDEKYINYKKITLNSFVDYFNNNIYNPYLKISSVQYFRIDDKLIYKCTVKTGNKELNINVIEISPNNWKMTLENFYNYEVVSNSYQLENAKINLETIYQTLDAIEFKFFIENNNEKPIYLNLHETDAALLYTSNNSIMMDSASISSVYSEIKPNSRAMFNIAFNIPLDKQIDIKKIVFNNCIFNDQEKKIEFNIIM